VSAWFRWIRVLQGRDHRILQVVEENPGAEAVEVTRAAARRAPTREREKVEIPDRRVAAKAVPRGQIRIKIRTSLLILPRATSRADFRVVQGRRQIAMIGAVFFLPT
jgi:hypothetical protein